MTSYLSTNMLYPFLFLVDNLGNFTIADEYSSIKVEMDAYYVGSNIIHIVDQVLLPISTAHFLGIETQLRASESETPTQRESTISRAHVETPRSVFSTACCVCEEVTDNFLVCAHPLLYMFRTT